MPFNYKSIAKDRFSQYTDKMDLFPFCWIFGGICMWISLRLYMVDMSSDIEKTSTQLHFDDGICNVYP